MKYNYNFKLNAVNMYRSGQWLETPVGIGQKNFRKRIVRWSKTAEIHGFDFLKHSKSSKNRTVEERYELVARVFSGESQSSVAINAGIDTGLLSKWVQIYKIKGYEGLNLKRGRRRKKEPPMTKKYKPVDLTPTEREELIRLRAETAYLKTENEAIKKLIALRHKKEAALLKAKKRQSSRNLKKKDIT
ncbi:helix-turn-helix domain-containing protein [Streptococcus dysgalactiae]|uniref:Helix-turn-helix domain-containing protein n=3 Tax=Streptococcus dysgalactiae TaxID=1334 RepID=A0AAE9UMR3_STRDY|nr:helix-turn-helix domain-containing protein [Streptococcus dysgalactiae]MEC4577272.1 helix-turn-helix domain-containing protein [Streptococcus dysgalactiae]MEC4577938.1 helix-turn-helix domain-containing protein [Streptococcus dysgalactiae]MEC4578520.1 helix-turn-helix domain-containing protein [Streptococcus dysgalactiae]MEC4578604.1 helix-turn-helix domain-containing protein [Streptococcus dysgalactiae]QGH03697.1 helix-turn-helix domain-containing protein [Streptococcus dysgalactiae subsp.